MKSTPMSTQKFSTLKKQNPEMRNVWKTIQKGEKVLVMFKSIEDVTTGEMVAVVGLMLPYKEMMAYLKDTIMEDIASCWDHDGQHLLPPFNCYLVDKSGLVIAASIDDWLATKKNTEDETFPRHFLGAIEPELFEHLVNDSFVKKELYKDFQGNCPSELGAIRLISAAGRVQMFANNLLSNILYLWNLLMSIVPFLLTFLSTNWFQEGLSFTLPKQMANNCSFHQTPLVEMCVIDRSIYTFNKPKIIRETRVAKDGEDQHVNSKWMYNTCRRQFEVFSLNLPGVEDLFLVEAEFPCDCETYNDAMCSLPPLKQWYKSEDCIEFQRNLRKPIKPGAEIVKFHKDEDDECSDFAITLKSSLLILVLTTIMLTISR